MPEYKVTKNAPDEILGKRAEAGKAITLTEEQAEQLLRKGHIEVPAKTVEPSKAAKKVENGNRN